MKTLDQWMISMALEELEPERIEEDQGDALVTFDAASHLSGDIGEVLHAAYCCAAAITFPPPAAITFPPPAAITFHAPAAMTL